MWPGLAVDLPVEELGCPDPGDHAAVGTADADVVAGTQLVAHPARHIQVRLLDVPAQIGRQFLKSNIIIGTF